MSLEVEHLAVPPHVPDSHRTILAPRNPPSLVRRHRNRINPTPQRERRRKREVRRRREDLERRARDLELRLSPDSIHQLTQHHVKEATHVRQLDDLNPIPRGELDLAAFALAHPHPAVDRVGSVEVDREPDVLGGVSARPDLGDDEQERLLNGDPRQGRGRWNLGLAGWVSGGSVELGMAYGHVGGLGGEQREVGR